MPRKKHFITSEGDASNRARRARENFVQRLDETDEANRYEGNDADHFVEQDVTRWSEYSGRMNEVEKDARQREAREVAAAQERLLARLTDKKHPRGL